MATPNLQPIRLIPGDAAKPPAPGMALCSSGGGYRAMVFHLGALLRLNEAWLLKKLNRISSVSGGSITAGMLGLKWNAITFNTQGVATNLFDSVVKPVLDLADHTLDVLSIVEGVITPFKSIAEEIADASESSLRARYFTGSSLR